MPVGDVNSNEKGSGARYNDGKPQLQLVPARFWRELAEEGSPEHRALEFLAEVQEHPRPWGDFFPAFDYVTDDLKAAADVFEYGIGKYAAWNWAKGMPWSVPTGCALRHIVAVMLGEDADPESGLPHWGHAMCNLIMLEWFMVFYPEGDDMALPLASDA